MAVKSPISDLDAPIDKLRGHKRLLIVKSASRFAPATAEAGLAQVETGERAAHLTRWGRIDIYAFGRMIGPVATSRELLHDVSGKLGDRQFELGFDLAAFFEVCGVAGLSA
jgi:hypothetical protein